MFCNRMVPPRSLQQSNGSASKFDHHAAWRRPSLAQERAAHAGHADLHRRELRPGRSVLRSIILPEHAGIISDAVRARAGVLPSKLLQLSFRALLKIDTVFADRWASEPSVARRATGPVWARCSAPRQRVCGFMEHGCGQALSVHVHEEGMVGERSAL